MKSFQSLLIFTFLTLTLYSQNVTIWGPQDIFCQQDSNLYYLESDLEIDSVIWEITPANQAQIIYSDDNYAQVEFYNSGTYLLTAWYHIMGTQEFDSTSITIFVLDIPPFIIIESCFVRNPLTNCAQVCESSVTTVFAEGGMQGSTGVWQIAGAESYVESGNTIEITWGPAGPGSIEYINQCGSTALCIEILPSPVASFETTPPTTNGVIEVCMGQEIFFENTSENGLTYTWSFGDGNQIDAFDTYHSYELTGTYFAKLTANSVCDCQSETEIVVIVLPAPAPTLDCVNSVCPETKQRYTATTDGCLNYFWSVSSNGTIVNGGEQSDDFIEVIWHEGPDGIIQLSVSNCNTTYCSSTNTFRVPIITPDGPIEGDPSVCSGEIVTYTAPYFKGTEYDWQVSPAGLILGGQNTNAITVKWNDVNTITNGTVSVNYQNCFLECGGDDQYSVQITPTITIMGDAQVCQNEMASISAQAGFLAPLPASVEWQILDEQDIIVFSSAGSSSTFNHTFSYPSGNYYWVALNNSDLYCNDFITQRISVIAKPTPPHSIVGETEICPGTPYGYTIENSGSFGTTWTITDGSNTINYIGQSIQHTFGPNAPYLIEAAHTDVQFSACNSTSISLAITSAENQVLMGADDACYQSIESYSIDFIGGATYNWEIIPDDMGDIQTTGSNEIQIFWSQVGPATLRLSLCGVILEKQVTVHALPSFIVVGPMEACGNEQVTIETDMGSLDHRWKDENGSVIGTDPTIDIFPGFYSVVVTDGFGCQSEQSFEIEELPFPKVSLTSPKLNFYCIDIPGGIPLVANTDDDNYTFDWFLDGIFIGNGPIISGNQFGTYEVEVTNGFGCSTLSNTVTIGECCPIDSCIAVLGGNGGGCPYLEFDFDVVTSETGCQTKNYQPTHPALVPGSGRWRISSISEGLLATYAGDIASHTYALPGYYRVMFAGKVNAFVYPSASCDHQDIFIDTVRLAADFTYGRACAGAAVDFEDLSTVLPGETMTNWAWDFGDPASGLDNTSPDQDPSHTFMTGGMYNVTLSVTLASGCISTKLIQVFISDGPTLDIAYDMINCEGEATSFSLNGNVFDVEWNFGDPTSGVENEAFAASTLHTFENPALYNVTVSAADIFTCRTTGIVSVDIRENTLAGDIAVAPAPIVCMGDTVTLTAPPIGTYWHWSNDIEANEIKVTETDQYSVFIRDGFNCTYTTPAVFVEVQPKPVIIAMAQEQISLGQYGPWVDTLSVCVDAIAEVHVFGAPGLTYMWAHGPTSSILAYGGDGDSYPGEGTFTLSVIGIDPSTGCASDPVEFVLEIYGLPSQPNIALTGGSGCSFDQNTLQVTNPEPGVTYVWSDGQQGQAIQVTEDGQYYVTGYNANGCENVSQSIFIQPAASVDQLPDGCFVACNPLTVCLPALNNVSSYTIFQNGSVFESGASWPADFVVTQDGSYTIEVVSTNGCVATSDPLDVILYSGVGIVTVLTYSDVDMDGVISAADTLVGGIPVQIESFNGSQMGMTETELNGQFDFVDYPVSNYWATINQGELDPSWSIVLDSLQGQIVNCDDSVTVSLLITQNCEVQGPVLTYELCPGDFLTVGDSTWSDTGIFELHLLSDAGCDSIIMVDVNLPDSIIISINVWSDVNNDQNVSGGDTLLNQITVVIEDDATGIQTIVVTDANGQISVNVPSVNYTISIDTTFIPLNFSPLIWELLVGPPDCGMVVLDFLLDDICVPVVIIDQATICPGDSVLIGEIWETEAGLYSVNIADPAGPCDTFLDFTLIVQPEMIVSADISEWCDSSGSVGSIILSVFGQGPFNFYWPQLSTTDSIQTGLTPGTYQVSIQDQNGCTHIETYVISPGDTLDFALDSLFFITEGGSAFLEVTGDISVPGLSISWNPTEALSCEDCLSPIATPVETSTYIASITDALGCTYNLSTVVVVFPDTTSRLSDFYLPNVFSPNDDGQNDRFKIFSKDAEAMLINMQVFDRWGDVLYQENNIPLTTQIGWDGSRRGVRLESQVVIFVAEVLMSDGKSFTLSGDVTLIR